MEKKRILFRADGNSETGLGHLYRLFSLVEVYREIYDFSFVTRETSKLKVIPRDYTLKIIPNNISYEDEADWLDGRFDSRKTIIIADGYHFNSQYQKRIKEKGFKLVFIDDLFNEYMYADIVINHSPCLKSEDFRAEKSTRFALGTKYAMLRPRFLEELNSKIKNIHKIKKVLVCFGGADLHDFSSKITNYLLPYNQIIEINVIVGAAYKHREIFDLQKKDNRIKILSNLSESEMLAVMKSSDMGVLPTSTISFEASAVGMLILGGYFVDNQEAIYRGFVETNSIYQIGDYNKITDQKMNKILNEVLAFSEGDFDFYLKGQKKDRKSVV